MTKFIVVAIHVGFAIINPRISLIGYLSLLHGIIIITAVFSIISPKQGQISGGVFLGYFVILILFGFISPKVFKEYYKFEWIRGCIINSRDGNLQLGFPVDRTEENCKCIYLKFEERYRNAKLFPSYGNYTNAEKIDVFNCTVDFLIPDSLNKDSIREKMENYLE